MRNTYRVVMVVAAAVLTSAAFAGPASAEPTGDTTVTFTVSAGALSITTPEEAGLGGVAPGGSVSGELGDVTVSDKRASADASWDTTVTGRGYGSGSGTPPESLSAGSVDYWSGPAIASTGTGELTPGQETADDRHPLNTLTALGAFTHTGGTGNNTATWNPTLRINVPLENIAGEYLGRVTHSVS